MCLWFYEIERNDAARSAERAVAKQIEMDENWLKKRPQIEDTEQTQVFSDAQNMLGRRVLS